MMKMPLTDRSRLAPATAAAALVLGLALAGCDRSDDTKTDGAVTPATPASSTTPSSTPSSNAAPASGASPAGNAQGQSTGSAGSGPSSDSSGAAGGGSSTATSSASTAGPASAPQGGESLTSTSAAGGGSGANIQVDASETRGGRDAKETNPQTLSKQEEKSGMPEALQSGHSHSSTALDAPQEENRESQEGKQ
jgi:hypothetical protein